MHSTAATKAALPIPTSVFLCVQQLRGCQCLIFLLFFFDFFFSQSVGSLAVSFDLHRRVITTTTIIITTTTTTITTMMTRERKQGIALMLLLLLRGRKDDLVCSWIETNKLTPSSN